MSDDKFIKRLEGVRKKLEGEVARRINKNVTNVECRDLLHEDVFLITCDYEGKASWVAYGIPFQLISDESDDILDSFVRDATNEIIETFDNIFKT